MKLVTYTHGAIARPGLLVTNGEGSVVLDLIRSIAWVDGKKNAATSEDRKSVV